MDIFQELGVRRCINAHDTYTIYGGSRMAPLTLRAMEEIAGAFVDMDELQGILGDRTAEMTRNEGAYFTNGASGGVLLAACVCMTKGNPYHYGKLPDTQNLPNEFIVMRAQRNAYDKAIETSGAKIVEIGDADETLEFELEGRISEKTAGIFYFASTLYQRGSLSLKKTIETAHKKGIPVVVDAAAQLPPVENLWRFTEMGADMVIFSGGKTLCGPQDSGLILGKREYIQNCRKFGSPAHGICRSCKTSREAMAGLYMAVKQYCSLDHEKNKEEMNRRNITIQNKIKGKDSVLRTRIVPKGPVGQDYPRMFCELKQKGKAEETAVKMRENGIFIGIIPQENTIYISPLNLTDEEAVIVGDRLSELL